ncbi:MAG: molybdopterin molybdotransferase MoeA [Rhodospirillales bacterium]|nr:molybdopterin molybdotransferase MoeA [Rhodospirillales bacterium]
MTQLSDDCFAFGATLMPLEDALALIDARVTTVVGAEPVRLRHAAGRILAEDVVAHHSVPPHDNAAVDGYAVRHADLANDAETRLRIAGRAAAGHPYAPPVGADDAVRIFTGAPMPAGADTVLMQEDCRADGDAVAIPPGIKLGANRRRAGEDVKAGGTVLTCGQRLRPQDVGLAAAVGRSDLTVYRPLRAAVFSTGDELSEPGDALPPGGICDSNRYALMAMLEGLGAIVTDLGILPDRYRDIRDALAMSAAGHDLVATSGGMSVGEEDHVKAAVQTLGSLHFWQLAIKPGRPIGLGQISGVPFVGLPGNPVAMMVTFMRIARPMILGLAGCTDRAPHVYTVSLGEAVKKKAGRREWMRARLRTAHDGSLVATRSARQGSGILSSLVQADGLIELSEDVTDLPAGAAADFLPFQELLR